MPTGKEAKEVKKKSHFLIILLVLVVLLGAGGAGAYFKFFKHQGKPGTVKKEVKPVFYSMNTFLVNLADPGAKRFLKVTMELELNSKEAARECKAMDFQLRDCVLTVLSSQESDAIVSAQEKVQLKNTLVKSLNRILPQGKVRAIYFTDFLIQ